MRQLTIALTISCETALSIGAGGSAGTLADKSIVRDGWGRPIIPGSQVKGKLRWAAEQLLRSLQHDIPSPFDEAIEQESSIRAIFGSPKSPSPLRFVDLPATIVPRELAPSMYHDLSRLRPSVSINRRRGVAEDQHLLIQEIGHEGMVFQHEQAVRGLLDDDQAERYAALLWAAIKITNRWGGATSRGLGWARAEAHYTLDGKLLHDDDLAKTLPRALALQGGAS